MGSKVGPYEITTALGAGGRVEVYKARDTRLGRDVALKVLPGIVGVRGSAVMRVTEEGDSRVCS